ncbi:unnamed protein product [Kluyveromyces dobzhanskii CBS 2104]|uniref:Acyl carrier protein n=1 Tax=Kluyveromyces dobzhanskii CBS 2104 TaxID=1427455 RepID=A0A0A8L5I2_9SACH|nr:unnamed protein product [Kluyveromyces dobzhanskii CBS 2104]
MFRSVFRAAPALTRVSGMRSGFVKPTFSVASRFYASSTLSKDEITTRIADVIKSFDKTAAAASITGETQFSKDLGLDSLDTVELLVSIEEEFDIEFPDKVADELKSVGETVDYISNNPEAN